MTAGTDDAGESCSRTVERVATVAYSLIVAAELVYLADVMSHGAVSRAVEPYVLRARLAAARVLGELEHERRVRLAARHVIFEAIETTRESARP